MKQFTIDEILKVYENKKYVVKHLPFEVNLFGVRNSDAESNTFDDCVGLFYKDLKNQWVLKQYVATTDPGLFYRINPITPEGTAIMVPGQYINCYKVGLHKGYPAIEQCGNMKYVRDNNKNKVLDFLYKVVGYKFVVGNIKSNIHHAGTDSKQVDNWSAACQVIAKLSDFQDFLSTIQMTVKATQVNLFNYALLEIENFK